MAQFTRKFGRGNRVSRHAAQHPGQARGSRRKRQRQAARAAELVAQAAALGITVIALRQRQQREVDAIIAAQRQARPVAYAPPVRSTWRSDGWW